MHEPLAIVLVGPRNPLNIGAAARAMSNFGFGDLRLVRPYDAAFREARSAARGLPVLRAARVYDSLSAAVADCTVVVGATGVARRTLAHPLLPLPAAARRLRRRARAALLFGNEKSGLSNEELSHCHWLLTIPTAETNDSLNLGQAVAVCLYEITRGQRGSSQEKKTQEASASDLEQLHRMLVEAAARSGYSQPRTAGSTELKLRRLLHRLRIRSGDAALWLGLFRQVLWALRKTPG
jgi:tRNA/rRNA methyltransferase